MSTLNTLAQDVYSLLETKGGGSDASSLSFGERLSALVKAKVSDEQGARLRPSNIGHACLRKLWYEVHKAEKLPGFDGQTLLKFMLGNTWEEALLFLAKEAGHDVKHEQLTVSLGGLHGSIDCIIDGCLVDVKSASPYAFDKYTGGLTTDNDGFGYIDQANFYLDALQDHPDLIDKDNAYLFVGDKTQGRLAVTTVPRIHRDWEEYINAKQEKLSKDQPPSRAFTPTAFGKSGNLAVPKVCNDYCGAVDLCWPGTRKFAYSSGVVRLTQVRNEPRVSEIFDH